MKIKRIVLGLLVSLFFSSCLNVPRATKLDSISITKKKIIDLVKDRVDRNTYIRRKFKLFDSVLDYCYSNRVMLEEISKNALLGSTVSAYISGEHCVDSMELNFIDTGALRGVRNYGELIYNMAVLYLAYRDLSNPVEFTRFQVCVQKLADSYVAMELFHSREAIELAKLRDRTEQENEDDARVKRLLDERIWFRKVPLALTASDFGSPVTCTPIAVNSTALPHTPHASSVFVTSSSSTVPAVKEVDMPDRPATAPSDNGLKNGKDSDESDLYEPFPTPGHFLAGLSRYSLFPGSLPVSRQPAPAKVVPSLSDEERELFAREMFHNPPKK